MLQGLICILLFVAIVILFLLVTICLFGHLVIVSFASAIGLSVVTNRYMPHNSSELLSVGLLLRPLADTQHSSSKLDSALVCARVLRGTTHKRRLQREGHSLLRVLRGETP